MNPEKEAALVKAFPHFFRDRRASPMQSAFAFGFEFEDGWYNIVYEAASKIEPILIKMIDDAIKNKDEEALDFIPTVSQAKEKYGTLRLYLTTYTDEIDNIVSEVEKKSETTCEECGQSGELRGVGWLYTRCDECWKRMEVARGER